MKKPAAASVMKASKAMKVAKPMKAMKAMKAMKVPAMKSTKAMKVPATSTTSAAPVADDKKKDDDKKNHDDKMVHDDRKNHDDKKKDKAKALPRPEWAKYGLEKRQGEIEVQVLEEGTWICSQSVYLASSVENMLTLAEDPGCSEKKYRAVGVAVVVEQCDDEQPDDDEGDDKEPDDDQGDQGDECDDKEPDDDSSSASERSR